MTEPVSSAEQTAAYAVSGNGLLEVRNVAKSFGPREVLKHISLEIASGEFLTLLGESGSGKTTLLRLIAGFEQPSSGEIWMSGERLDPAIVLPFTSSLLRLALLAVNLCQCQIRLPGERGILFQLDHALQ